MTKWQKLVAWWNSLPHYVQAPIAAFGAGVGGVIEKAAEQYYAGTALCTVSFWHCVGSYAEAALKAGVIMVIGLYIKSSYHK